MGKFLCLRYSIFHFWYPHTYYFTLFKTQKVTIHSVRTLNMIVDGKNGEKKSLFKFWQFFLRNHGFLRNTFFIFLVISQELFDLQRRTIPHFNCLKELITPLLQCNCHRIRHFWDIRRNVFPIFFYPYFSIFNDGNLSDLYDSDKIIFRQMNLDLALKIAFEYWKYLISASSLHILSVKKNIRIFLSMCF